VSRSPEFIPLSDETVRAVAGPASRHAALMEDAFDVLIETPGGGVSLSGDAKARTSAKQVIETLARRVDQGLEVAEADVRVAIGQVRTGRGAAPAGLPSGRRGQVAPKTAAQARYLDALGKCELVFGLGPAGTGKTFLAVAHGAGLLLRGEVDRLIVSRPAVEAGERLGFLPGDLSEKVDPYMAPVWEALTDILGVDQFRRRREKGEIELAPIAFMRGRTLAHAFVIVDEAQGARMVVTGDPSQCDLPNPADSGLAHAVSLLDGVKGVGVARFATEDVVRHPLVERIVRAYEADQAKTTQARKRRSGEAEAS